MFSFLVYIVFCCYFSLGNFISTAEKIRLPDDCTIGYIIEALLEVRLTHSGLFHSHLENLQKLPADSLLSQVRKWLHSRYISLWESNLLHTDECVFI